MDIDAILSASKELVDCGGKDPVIIAPSQKHESKQKVGTLCGMEVYTHKQFPVDTDLIILSRSELERL